MRFESVVLKEIFFSSCLCLLVFVSNSTPCLAEKVYKKIIVKKPGYQVPMMALEQYAKGILSQGIAKNSFNFDWKINHQITSFHRDKIENSLKNLKHKTFKITDLRLVRTEADDENYYFTFEFVPPPSETIKLTSRELKTFLFNLDVLEDDDHFTLFFDIILGYPNLMEEKEVSKRWMLRFAYYSYDALFKNRANEFDAIKLAPKHISLEALPSDKNDALKLFDVAPFNHAVCVNAFLKIDEKYINLQKKIYEHCTKIDLGLNWRGKPLGHSIEKSLTEQSKDQEKLDVEIKKLKSTLGFDLFKHPILYVMLASVGEINFDKRLVRRENKATHIDDLAEFNPKEMVIDSVSTTEVQRLKKYLEERSFLVVANKLEIVLEKFKAQAKN